MSFTQPFAPHFGSTQTLSATTSSQVTVVAETDRQVRALNTGSSIVYLRTGRVVAGDPTLAATAADYPVAPGQASIFTMAEGDNRLAYIGAAAGTVVISTGNGW